MPRSEPAASPVKRPLGTALLVGFMVFFVGLTVGFWVAAYQDLAGPYCDKHLMRIGDTCSRLHHRGFRGGYTREHLNHPGEVPVKLTLPANLQFAPEDVFNGVYSPATMRGIHHGDGLEFLAGGVLFTVVLVAQVYPVIRRARRGPPTDDPSDLSAWNRVPRGAGRRGKKAVVAGLLPAEPRYRHGLRSWVIVVGALGAAVGASAGTRAELMMIGCPDFVALALAGFAPFAVVVGVVVGNRQLSRCRRARMSRDAVTAAGEIIDCTTFDQLRRGNGRNHFVNVTVRFLDPEFLEPPQWIRRSYLFIELPTTAAQFATRYANGVAVTVRRNTRCTWYGLDVDDDHLIWSQWW
jgi:hypothetical protein